MANTRGKPRKLLISRVGIGTLTIVAATAFPACNLLPPPPCDSGTSEECGRAPRDAQPDAPSDAGDLDAADLDAADFDDV